VYEIHIRNVSICYLSDQFQNFIVGPVSQAKLVSKVFKKGREVGVGVGQGLHLQLKSRDKIIAS